MASMVRIQYVSLLRQRSQRGHACRRGTSLSLLFVSVGLASLGFLIITEVGMMQKRAVALPARVLVKASHQSGVLPKGKAITHLSRADPFKIEPLLRQNALSAELSAQLYLNSIAAGKTGNDLESYYRSLQCQSQHKENSTICRAFTMNPPGFGENDWWKPYTCAAYPPNLLPPRFINRRLTIRLSHLDGQVTGVTPGGAWNPPTCLARHSIAIIVPYRDRWRHLTTLLNHLHPILQRQLLKYRIYVVEQYGNETFNKGTIMNAAFLEALKDEIFDCFIFHDVDLIPENDYNLYSCPQMPRHLSVAVNELFYKLPYHILAGGVLAIRTDHFFKVNGYSNLFWGWGGEDDDMGLRIHQSGLQLTRPLPRVGRYTMIKHVKRKGTSHRIVGKLVRTAKRRYRLDGLNTIQYRVISKTEGQWFTMLLVDIGSQPAAFKATVSS